jgi:hypothetical protein
MPDRSILAARDGAAPDPGATPVEQDVFDPQTLLLQRLKIVATEHLQRDPLQQMLIDASVLVRHYAPRLLQN